MTAMSQFWPKLASVPGRAAARMQRDDKNERRNLHYYPRSLDSVGESGAHAMATNLLPPSSRRTV